nr:right-handed parallel beta-helix repeat-containing protein [uncultured Cohaesibacter sp.]
MGPALFDSEFNNNFIESNGGVGLKMAGGNNRVDGCFIDLNRHGIEIVGGDRPRITNTGVKWNLVHGIYVTGATERPIISDCTVMGNNYRSATDGASIGYAIRFAAKVSNFTIDTIDFCDKYEGTAHAEYKSVRQGNINFGSTAGTSGQITSCTWSEEDDQWDAGLIATRGITDGGSFVSTGAIAISNCRWESGENASHLRPVASGSDDTLALNGVLEVTDKLGAVAGYVPVMSGSNPFLSEVKKGTFTAGLVCASGTAILAAAENTLAYVKIGPMVHISGQIGIATVDNPSGSLRVTGSPFVAADITGTAGTAPVGLVRGTGMTGTPVNGITGRIVENSSAIAIEEFTGLTIDDTFASHLQANTKLVISITYFSGW